MASDCEVLIGSHSRDLATTVTQAIAAEAHRIESKYSRYDDRSVVGRINSSEEPSFEVDDETGKLIDYASTIFELSEGAFDITTGALARCWRFDGSDKIPSKESITELMDHVGWNKVSWHKPILKLPIGMAIDFGGIGKEYAVDSAFAIATRLTSDPFLINFGGDIRATAAPVTMGHWTVGINLNASDVSQAIALPQGGLATSGDTNRYLLKDGQRYSHILDARTGWPVVDAPQSVTVAAPTCVEAGMLATLASLEGAKAEAFLEEQNVQYWINR